MKTLIIVHSYHHNNTLKIAKAMGGVLNADIQTPEQAKCVQLDDYDLIGFGAGIDSGMHYKELLDFVNTLGKNDSKKCFVFSTSAIYNDKKMAKDHSALRKILIEKSYNIIGEFSCIGFNTNSILKYVGGMNKGYPTIDNINNAKHFATKIMNEV